LDEYPKKNSGPLPVVKVKGLGIPPFVGFAIVTPAVHVPDRISELTKLVGFAAF